MQIVVDELRAVREKHGDERRTEILAEEGEFRIEDLIAEEDMAITVSNTGYIKRTAITNYRNQRRGGKGRIGMRTREEDFVSHLFVASTHAYIMIFSDRGRAYWLKVHEIPDVGPDGRGKAIANLVSMEEGERIAALLTVKEFEEDKFIVMGTRARRGQEDRAERLQQPARRRHHRDGRRRGRRGHRRAGLRRQRRDLHRHPRRDVDPLRRDRRPVDGPHRPTACAASRCATTTRSWRWKCCDPGGTILSVTEQGYGKRTELDEYRVQSRGGIGIINIQTSDRNGKVVGITQVHRRRRADADHAAGQDPADGVEGHPDDRPRHAGRAADRHRRRRPRGVDCPPGRKGRRQPRGMARAVVAAATLDGSSCSLPPPAAGPRPSASSSCDFFERLPRLRHDRAGRASATAAVQPAAPTAWFRISRSSSVEDVGAAGRAPARAVDARRPGAAARRLSRRRRRLTVQAASRLDGRWMVAGGYATSSFANFARSVFCPTELNRTTSLVSSSSGSMLRTVPSPNCRVAHADARPQARRHGLVLVLVGVGRLFLAHRAALPCRTGSRGTARTTTGTARRTSTGLPRSARAGISSMKRDGSVDW